MVSLVIIEFHFLLNESEFKREKKSKRKEQVEKGDTVVGSVVFCVT